MDAYTIVIIASAVLAVCMLAIYRFTEGKTRYILLCVVGVVVWLAILSAAIYLGETRIAAFVAFMLFAYVVSLAWWYVKYIRKI